MALTEMETERIRQYKLSGQCDVPAGEIEKIIEAYVEHGITPNQMRKMGITKMSEYFIKKCLVNSGAAEMAHSRKTTRSVRTKDIVAELQMRVAALEDMVRKMSRQEVEV